MSKKALILIDLQNDYYPGGLWTLHNIDAASANASKVLAEARSRDYRVIHVRHEFQSDDAPFFKPGSTGAHTHPSVSPIEGEQIVLKHAVNAFKDTQLKNILDADQVIEITIIGAMSHMCIDAATRAASDFGYQVTVVEDACASRDLDFNGKTIAAKDVHGAYMSALSFAYADIKTTQQWLNQ